MARLTTELITEPLLGKKFIKCKVLMIYNNKYFSEHVYFGNMQNGHKFDYEPKEEKISGASYESQITFLRLLSTQARQVYLL